MKDLLIRSLTVDWTEVAEDSYLREIPALRGLEHLAFRRPVTFFAGENGSGKSTLLEAIAVAYGFNAEGGSRNFHFSTYEDVSELGEAVRFARGTVKPGAGYFFRAESFFNVATAIVERYNDGAQPDYHQRSHGESFLEYMSRSGRPGLYLMDEPEAALSAQRQLTLLCHIAQRAAAGSQFIIATHSPILLAVPDAEILEFSESGIHPCAWRDTESYRVTKLFLDNPERMLQRLLEE